MARIGITLDENFNERFSALAELRNKKPSTLAAEIIKSYMETCKADIDNILRVKADYEKNVAELRNREKNSSDDETAKK